MVFCSVQKFFFGQHESQNIYFFCSAKREFFFPEFNIKLYDKNSESDFSLFPPAKSEYFFQQHWESEYFFRKKTITPFKLNGRSLKTLVKDQVNKYIPKCTIKHNTGYPWITSVDNIRSTQSDEKKRPCIQQNAEKWQQRKIQR